MKRRSIAMPVCLAAGLFVNGCSTTTNPVTSPSDGQRPGLVAPPAGGDQTSCNAESAQWTIGAAATTALLESARVAATAEVARFVVRGRPLTTEFVGARLNLEIDERQLVVAVRCG